MTITQEKLISLVKIALASKKDDSSFRDELSTNDWSALLRFAQQEGIGSIIFDVLERIPAECRPEMNLLLNWYGQTSYQETIYGKHKEIITKLASFYSSHGIKMLLLKGVGLSFNYPQPNHRLCGDIDVYLYGDGGKADSIMLSELGIKSKQNEDKHSVFVFDGITVENHACIINYARHPSQKALEQLFEQDAKYAIPVNQIADDWKGFYLPSVSMNALYIPLHIADHFIRGEASLRQLVDWTFFVQKYHTSICWNSTADWAKKSGFFKFYCCLNGIIQDYLCVDASFFPNWPRDKKLEYRVLNEILTNRAQKKRSLYIKVVNFFSSAWKFRLVYNESIFLAAIRQARAYALVKWNKGRRNIWDKA